VLYSGPLVRALIVVMIVVMLGLTAVMAAACFGSVGHEQSYDPNPGDDGAGNGSGRSRCSLDDECVPAGATCCECPTFAVNRADPIHKACTGVMCPGEGACSDNVSAVCSEDGFCELACAPLACAATTCAAGYALDVNGCLTCDCAVPLAGGCTASSDCTRTRADCCGCRFGGSDTAVLAVEQMKYDAMLMCPPAPACPGIDVCQLDEPQCVQGRCELLPPGLPPGACGRTDLPGCPAGTVCTVNLSDPANMQGVGVCAPP
jgi:hypothetical protein